MALKNKNVFLLQQDEALNELISGYDAAHITKGGGLSRPRLTEAFKKDKPQGWYGPVVWIIRPTGIAVFTPASGITRKQAFRLLRKNNLQPAERRVIPLPEAC